MLDGVVCRATPTMKGELKMKYYKLKNDIPMFKKGDLFFIHPEEGCLLQKDTLRLAYHKETLEKNPEILKDWFEEIPEKHERWRGGRGDSYYFIDDEGAIRHEIDTNDGMDNYRYNIGNYFKTEAEAESYKKYLTARQVLLDDAEGGKWIENGENWHAFYNTITETYVRMSGMSYYFPGVIYFKDGENLYKSLKEHEEQWEIVRKYEMGEKR